MTDNTSAARFVGLVLEKNGQAAAIANVRVWIHDVPKGNWGAEFLKANRAVAPVLYVLVAIKSEVTGDGIDTTEQVVSICRSAWQLQGLLGGGMGTRIAA